MTSTPAVRPPLTTTEKAILKELVETLSKTDSHFCCGGTFQLPADQKLSLLYRLGDGDHAHSLDLPSTKVATDVEKLLEACAPSPHGRGKETVYDESYRLARELLQGDFALTTDFLNESGVLPSIAALTSPRNPDHGLVACLYKLNAYTAGGFFKPHRDTPKSDRHIGTLVVALPVPFKGGALSISHEGKQVLFDWSEVHIPVTQEVSLQWAFLFSDAEHEVLPVTSGTRVTLAYDIFVSPEACMAVPSAIDGTSIPFYSDLRTALKNQDFLPQGGKLGVALSHSYPINSTGTSDSFASHLKGSDAALHRALSALGIAVNLRAVYTPNDAHEVYDAVQRRSEVYPVYPDDEFRPIGPRTGRRYPVLYTSDKFFFIEGCGEWDEGESQLLKEYAGARVEPEIIWARKPSDEAFS